MPRPSKKVAPDTLGGKLRTARQLQSLSLADVAGNRYSTSLISQIERNRVDPSAESLQYLAERLKLPLDDLLTLAHQHRQLETEANLYKVYEEKYAEINHLLAHRESEEALRRFSDFDPVRLPLSLRWRTLALRGQSHFEQRKFPDAQRDFQSALTVLPPSVVEDEQLEVVKLRLHLAAATRELNQFETALKYYREALAEMTASTPLRYVAEVHWGLALVYFRQGQSKFTRHENEAGEVKTSADFLHEAWRHAEDARTLYSSIADLPNAALLQCQVAQVELEQGNDLPAQQKLLGILMVWQPTLEEPPATMGGRTYTLAERANVVSAAACCLANLEYQAGRYETALKTVEIAVQASRHSYKLRQAEALMKLGEILQAWNPAEINIEETLRAAVDVLAGTHRLVALIQAHYKLGYYLLSVRRVQDGQQEIEKAHELAGLPRGFDTLMSSDEDCSSNGV